MILTTANSKLIQARSTAAKRRAQRPKLAKTGFVSLYISRLANPKNGFVVYWYQNHGKGPQIVSCHVTHDSTKQRSFENTRHT